LKKSSLFPSRQQLPKENLFFFKFIFIFYFFASARTHTSVRADALERPSVRPSENVRVTTLLIAGSVPVGAAAQPTAAILTEAEIAVLVATHLRRYLQTMVWDVPVDETAHLSERSVAIISLDPVKAMSPKRETTLDLEAELLIKTKDYSWSSIVSLLNIPAVMKNIRCITGLSPDFMF
jgi:hypothetical protein